MNDRSLPLPTATPVKRAYEQVAAQIRQWIVTGFLGVGDKLPAEAQLCEQFGTSRSTVREALRLLSSERLIVTQPGAHGGSVVSKPSAANVSDGLTTSLATLVGASDLSIAEMVQVRLILEVPAAGMAAAKCGEDTVERLAGLVPDSVPAVEHLFDLDFAFHQELLEASGNRLLPIVALPVFEVSARRVPRNRLDQAMWERVVDEHRAIVEAIRSRDVAAAESAMRLHLSGLAASYELAIASDQASAVSAQSGPALAQPS
ncbi:FadR/GntR family transcriptional regulator [Williamsia muralis]|uniref:Transcriptional regulator n=1 Tax=Williamsia marianensis TaxID=85044 RepID=A0A2G3PN15_WILMA|nr:FadR/GntR family transcriptional regulator [Williamsia marianensis]PHV67160.1 transcriptional regulator [Williamsia marianensis]